MLYGLLPGKPLWPRRAVAAALTCALCSSPPGLTDEEIDVAFQQSGTAAEEPPSLGPAAQVVPGQPPHLVSQPQPYSKSPTPPLAFALTGIRDSSQEQSSRSPRLRQQGGTGRSGSGRFPEKCDTPKSSLS